MSSARTAALNGRRSVGSRLGAADGATLRALGRRVAAVVLSRGATRATALVLARAADAAAVAGHSLPDIAGELRIEVAALLAAEPSKRPDADLRASRAAGSVEP